MAFVSCSTSHSRVGAFYDFFFYPRSGESQGAEEKLKGDHLGQLPGFQKKVGDGLLLDRQH